MDGGLKSAPDFDLENIGIAEIARLDGSAVAGAIRASDLKGKVAVIDLWATWCEPCIREIPRLNQLYESYQGKDVAIVAITVESPYDSIASKVREFGMKYPVLVGNDGVVAGFGLVGFPTTFVIDKDWRIYKKYLGSLPNKHEEIRQDIARLLSQ